MGIWHAVSYFPGNAESLRAKREKKLGSGKGEGVLALSG